MRLSDPDRRVAHRVAAILLGYPDDELLAQLPLLKRAATGLPDGVGVPLARMLDHMTATAPAELAAHYVETFDLRRRCCLYLTYYAYGDTRKRGMALLRFRHAYRQAGMEFSSEELPDHLAVVLESSALAESREQARAAGRLLAEHRAGIELLARALAEDSSPYADVLTAVQATLPAAGPRDIARALRLARDGPPAEDVGLEPFDPIAAGHRDGAGRRR